MYVFTGKHNSEASDIKVGAVLNKVHMYMDWVLDTLRYITC
jgi:hypothetical protein